MSAVCDFKNRICQKPLTLQKFQTAAILKICKTVVLSPDVLLKWVLRWRGFMIRNS